MCYLAYFWGVKKNNRHKNQEIPDYLETPAGIFTKNGVWFHTSIDSLKEFSGDLCDRVPLGFLFDKAEQWIKSTDSVGAVLILSCLFFFPLYLGVALGLFLIWLFETMKPAFVSIPLIKIIELLNKDAILLTVAVIPLSWFGMSGMYHQLVVGIILFLCFKFGWVRSLFEKIRSDNTIPMNDRVLHMVINKYAIREGIATQSTKIMEQRIIQAMDKSSQQRSNILK